MIENLNSEHFGCKDFPLLCLKSILKPCGVSETSPRCLVLSHDLLVLLLTHCRNLALGIGIQNFPEGLAVSLPLKSSGMNVWKSFW